MSIQESTDKECDIGHEHGPGCTCGCNDAKTAQGKTGSWLSRLCWSWLRFGAAWIGLGGLWSMTNVCPCCGQPVGACGPSIFFTALIGFLGAIFITGLRFWSRLTSRPDSSSSTESTART